MNKRNPLEKEEARARRDRLMHSATQAQLSLTDGVREMRAISGLTQDQFAVHRGLSSRVIKALELGKGNPTVATLNRISHFYGLEVGFVPINRRKPADIGTGVELDKTTNALALIKEAVDQHGRVMHDLLKYAEQEKLRDELATPPESTTEQVAESNPRMEAVKRSRQR